MMRFTAFFAVIVLANASGLYSLGDLASYGLGLGDGSLSRQEIRSPDGIIRGTLTYIDGDGKIKSISYGGDNDVAEIQKASASTEAPMEAKEEERPEPEEQQKSEDSSSEKAEEMKEATSVEESSSENNQNKTSTMEENGAAQAALPQPVAYTPEVAAARAAHFAARDQAILLQQIAANQEQLEANQQLLLNQQQIVEYPPFLRDYYGAAKPLKSLNPYYYL